jgi:hypothetical protein
MTSCFDWVGCKNSTGYGTMSRGKEGGLMAHRVSYEMVKGPIPEGMVVMHSCDNPACVNPDHLSVGTQADNLADMHRKGRREYSRGSAHKGAILADTDIPFIRSLAGVFSQRKLAALYGVSRSAICGIQSRRKWSHIS